MGNRLPILIIGRNHVETENSNGIRLEAVSVYHTDRREQFNLTVRIYFFAVSEHNFIQVVLLNRVFKEDKFLITFKEIQEWLEYMWMAGVQHVHVYDNWRTMEESQFLNYLPYQVR